MIAVIVLGVFVAAAVAFVAWGSVLIRRHNRHLAELSRHPVTPMRFRHLNVVDRCDMTLSCHARSHEPSCLRGRAIGDQFINRRHLHAIDNEAD